jgi:hypothetical protein
MLFAQPDLGGQLDGDAGAGLSGGQLGIPQGPQLLGAVGGCRCAVDRLAFALVILQRAPRLAGGVLQRWVISARSCCPAVMVFIVLVASVASAASAAAAAAVDPITGVEPGFSGPVVGRPAALPFAADLSAPPNPHD